MRSINAFACPRGRSSAALVVCCTALRVWRDGVDIATHPSAHPSAGQRSKGPCTAPRTPIRRRQPRSRAFACASGGIATQAKDRQSALDASGLGRDQWLLRSSIGHRAGEAQPPSVAKAVDQPAGEVAVLLNGIALAPPSAPEAVKATITAANTIVGTPYVWGGGHDSWYSRGYDCSGAVSFALAGGGFLGAPRTSSELESWGKPGPGRWLTVYANGGHTYAVIAGLRWDTVGGCPRVRGALDIALPYPQGFVARHPPGY